MARISDNEQPRKGAEPAGRSAGAGTVHEPRIVPADNHGVPPAAHTAGHLGGGLPVCRPRFSVFALAAQLAVVVCAEADVVNSRIAAAKGMLQ